MSKRLLGLEARRGKNRATVALHQIRQAKLDAHYAKHPERYINGPPKDRKPPTQVCINPIDGITQTGATALAESGSFRAKSLLIDEPLPGAFVT